VCDGGYTRISCGFINNHFHVTPTWKIIKRSSTGSIINIMKIIPPYVDGGIRMVWKYDDNNTENSRLLVGPVDMTYNQSSFQCIIQTYPALYSTFGTLTVAGEILYVCMYISICLLFISLII